MRKDWLDIETHEIGELHRGITYKKAQSQKEPDHSLLPVLRANNINGILNYDDLVYVPKSLISEEQIVKDGDIIFAMSSGSKHLVGKSAQATSDFKGSYGAFCSLLRVHKPIVEQYIGYFFKSNSFKKLIWSISKGTNINNLKREHILNFSVPLAPLPEQRAIVAKIEELFSDLDDGIADLKKAQDQLTIYRQAVLKKAFEGSFEEKKICDLAEVQTGATPKRGNSAFWKNGTIPWITSGAVNNMIVEDANEFITEKALKETNCKIIKKGALLVAMYGEGKTRGKCSILGIDATTNQALAGISLKPEFDFAIDFIKWFFVKNYHRIRLLSAGGVQPNLNLSIIKNTVVSFPSKLKQMQIVKDLESQLSICDQVEQNIIEGLIKAEALRQSILKKAFSGELLTDVELEACKKQPDWEPAEKLLARIKEEKKSKK